MKADPIDSPRPTNADLARGFNQLHRCHEDTKEKVESVQATVTTILSALGLDEGGKPVAGLSSSRKAFWRTFTATGGAIAATAAVLRFSEVLWPWVKGGAMALLHAAEQGKL